MPMTTEQRATLEDVTQFIYREARLQDEHQYDAWESLWADDGVYWVPANGDDIDPEKKMSILYDNRSRIALRIRQYHTGKRFSQTPQSRLRREGDDFRMALKKVMLVNNHTALYSMAFLI